MSADMIVDEGAAFDDYYQSFYAGGDISYSNAIDTPRLGMQFHKRNVYKCTQIDSSGASNDTRDEL